jgi:hypothetical protein
MPSGPEWATQASPSGSLVRESTTTPRIVWAAMHAGDTAQRNTTRNHPQGIEARRILLGVLTEYR